MIAPRRPWQSADIIAPLLAFGLGVALFVLPIWEINVRARQWHDPDFCLDGLRSATQLASDAYAHNRAAGMADAYALAADVLTRCSRDPHRPERRRAGYARAAIAMRRDAQAWRVIAQHGTPDPFRGPSDNIPSY